MPGAEEEEKKATNLVLVIESVVLVHHGLEEGLAPFVATILGGLEEFGGEALLVALPLPLVLSGLLRCSHGSRGVVCVVVFSSLGVLGGLEVGDVDVVVPSRLELVVLSEATGSALQNFGRKRTGKRT